MTNFFNKSKTDLILPQVFKEYDESSSDDNDYKPQDNSAANRIARAAPRSHSQTNSPRQVQPIIPNLYTTLYDNTEDVEEESKVENTISEDGSFLLSLKRNMEMAKKAMN